MFRAPPAGYAAIWSRFAISCALPKKRSKVFRFAAAMMGHQHQPGDRHDLPSEIRQLRLPRHHDLF